MIALTLHGHVHCIRVSVRRQSEPKLGTSIQDTAVILCPS